MNSLFWVTVLLAALQLCCVASTDTRVLRIMETIPTHRKFDVVKHFYSPLRDNIEDDNDTCLHLINLAAEAEVTTDDNDHTIPSNSTIMTGFSFFFTTGSEVQTVGFCNFTVKLPLICSNNKHKFVPFNYTIPNQLYSALQNITTPLDVTFQLGPISIPVDSICPGGIVSYYSSEVFNFALGIVSSSDVNTIIMGNFYSVLIRPGKTSIAASGPLIGITQPLICACNLPSTVPTIIGNDIDQL